MILRPLSRHRGARAFTSAGVKSLNMGSAAVLAAPLTMLCRFYFTTLPTGESDGVIFSLGNSGRNDRFWITFDGSGGVNAFYCDATVNGVIARNAITTPGISANTWYSGAAIYTDSSNRTVYLNNTAGTSNTGTNPKDPVGLDDTRIGGFIYSGGDYGNINGYVADAAIYNVAITTTDLARYVAGESPLNIRRNNLVFYTPFFDGENRDIISGRLLKNNGGVVGVSAYGGLKPVRYGRSRLFVPDVTAAGNTTVSPTTGSIIVAGSAPTVKQNILRQPTVGSVVVTGNAPTVKQNILRQPAVGSVIVAGNAPAVVTGGDKVVNPNTGTIVVSGLAPTLKTNTIRQPTVGSVVVAGAAPTVRQGVVRLPTVGSIVVAGLVPTVSYTSHVVRTPSAGTITVAGNAPEIIGASIWTNVAAASTIWTNASAATTSWTNQ